MAEAGFRYGGALAHAARERRGSIHVCERRGFFRGQLPKAERRCIGGYSVYVALDRPFRFRAGSGPWMEVELAVSAPYETHSIDAGSGFIAELLIEQEDVPRDGLPDWVQGATGPVDCAQLAARLRRACSLIQAEGSRDFVSLLDGLVFDRPLPRRELDPRISRVVTGIASAPSERHLAQDHARSVGLSLSRFLHLFKSEVGSPFRRFRAWKRARGLFYLISNGGNLTDIALDSGYADSSNFSHSIRDVFGLCPRQIVFGLRRIAPADLAGRLDGGRAHSARAGR